MSSNLLKRVAYSQTEEKKIIDTNALLAKKMSKYAFAQGTSALGDGFSQGLNAEDITSLLTEEQEEAEVYEGPSPEEMLQQAREEIDRMQEEAQALIETERRKLLEEARSKGYQEGYAQGVREADQLKAEVNKEKRLLEEEYQTRIDELEPEFIDTLTGIYEHIFHVELKNYKDIIIHLINTTIRKVESSKNFIIHVSKEDYPYVSMQKKLLTAGNVASGITLEIIEDIAVGQNECLIEADGGIFDCGLGTQMEELAKKLKLLSYEKI